MNGFPDEFVWGVATAAYQIEGAVAADGRGPSIWDTFSHTPGRVRDGDTGDVACDHYHRWAQDVALMADLGIPAYRFSIAWPRVQPDGRGRGNQAGLDFYRRLIDGLLDAGITPVPTLYHWDLPQALYDQGGWGNRDTAGRFADYAEVVAAALGDRIGWWWTLNEPWVVAFLGHAAGVHAPGETAPQRAIAATHHQLLGHGLAVEALRAAGTPGTRVGIVLNLAPVAPAGDSDADRDAAAIVDGLQNRLFLDPLLHGRYPEDVLARWEPFDTTVLDPEDLPTIAQPLDALGINYYFRHHVRAGDPGPGPSPWPGAHDAVVVDPQGPRTAMGWGIEPDGLTEVLARVHRDYPPVPLYVTENGAAFDDTPDASGFVDDADREQFLDTHVRAAADALAQGVDLRGYFVWSLLDNFEWAEGYARRFGIVRVDYATQERIPKRSARWYARTVAAGGPA